MQAEAQKAPRLPNGHRYVPETAAEWKAWHELGFASRWTVVQTHVAMELLSVIDAFYRSADDPGRQARLAKEIRQARRALGLLEPSPLS